jgi:hypothetical protein
MKSSRFILFAIFALCFVTVVRAGDTNRASQILTAELAQKILGTPVESGSTSMPDTEIGQTWVSRISYHAKTGGASAPSVSLLIRHAAGATEAQTIFESSKATFHGEDVAGLGNPAYRVKTPAQLNILKGTNWLIISAGTFQTPDPIIQEKAAREILAKMPNS